MKWGDAANPPVGMDRTARMTSPELAHPAAKTPLRQRQYVAPGSVAPVNVEPTDRRHSFSSYQPASQATPPIAAHNRDSPHDYVLHPSRGSFDGERRRQQRCVRLFLPSRFPLIPVCGEQTKGRELSSWRQLPENPLDGLPGVMSQPAPTEPEDYKFYCDPCQKGFFTQEKYDKHMSAHIWCTIPGCRFTCKKDKEWKMEMHMETLHNRPDAPNLADVNTYLLQRRQRFPTQDAVKTKVEELFYKASRGIALPEERRRWLRQHGVCVRNNPRTEETYIVSDALRRSARAAVPKTTEEHCEQKQQRRENNEKEEEVEEMDMPPTFTDHHHHEEKKAEKEEHQQPGGGNASTTCDSVSAQHPPGQSRSKRIVPLGPNGTLTRGQKIQLVRDKYRDTKTVLRFYVCHRCGEKGTHWVDECPTRGDEAFERQLVWGEERRGPPQQRRRVESETEGVGATAEVISEGRGQRSEVPAAEEGDAKDVTTCRSDAASSLGSAVEEEGDGPPVEMSARRAQSPPTEVTRMLAPVAAAAAAAGREGRRRQEQPQRRARRPPPPPPTLYERLVESEKVNERGLLVQAFRFFVMRNFFSPCEVERLND